MSEPERQVVELELDLEIIEEGQEPLSDDEEYVIISNILGDEGQ